MSPATRRGIVAALAAVATCAVLGLYIGLYLINVPGSAAATRGPAGYQLDLATVASAEVTDAHPTWVSYYAVDAQDQHWRHATTYVLPAHALVHVTIYQFDSATGLRNPFISQAQGTVGGTFSVNGSQMNAISPSDASHIFAVPAIGLSVPLPGVSATAKNPCANAPCTLSNDHETVSFTFRTPGRGLYRWQCYVPCGSGFIDGNGGPMQTEGYMDGYIKVV